MTCPCRATEYALMENAKRGKRIAELEECLLTAEERLEQMTRERDEARELLYLTKAELGRWVDRETKAVRERDEARAEVQEHREQLRKLPDANRVSNQAAYRRGAEAMREACAQWVDHWVSGHVADKLRGTPIPEEP